MNNFIFSAEEINLMCIFDTSNKKVLIKDLRESLPDIYDIEMREIYESTIEKLEKISDEDFSEIGIYIADEFIEGEEYEIAE
jgi:hypothetical protein